MSRATRTFPFLLALGLGLLLSWWLVARTPDRADAPARPQRVVLFAPNLTETAWALGHGDVVVGITDYCVWPPQLLERPRVGGMIDPNFERLAALSPDLFVLQGENLSLRTFAREQGWSVFNLKMDEDLESVLRGVVQLDSLLNGGDDARGRALADSMRRELAAMHVDAPPLRTLLVLGREPGSLEGLFTCGPGTFLADLLRAVGATPWVDDGKSGYRMIALEALVADPPELAIEVHPSLSSEEAAAVWRRSGLDEVEVRTLDFDGAMIPGPRVVETARRLRAILEDVRAGRP